MKTWIYYQIFFKKWEATRFLQPTSLGSKLTAVCDAYLLDVVEPLIASHQTAIDASFFIRYITEGYHVRLRLFGEPEYIQAVIYVDLRKRTFDFFNKHQVLDIPITEPHDLEVQGYVVKADYEPEVEKYGGIAGSDLAEAHFTQSSQMALWVLAAERQTRKPRSLWASELAQSIVNALTPDPVAQAFLALSYANFWLRSSSSEAPEAAYKILDEQYKQKYAALQHTTSLQTEPIFTHWTEHLVQQIEAWQALEAAHKITSPLQDHLANNAAFLTPYPAFAQYPFTSMVVIPNYLHMLNNRLGITVPQEVQLSYFLYRSKQINQLPEPFLMFLEPLVLKLYYAKMQGQKLQDEKIQSEKMQGETQVL